MTDAQAKALRKAERAFYTAAANLRAASDINVIAAAGEYLNAKRVLDNAIQAVALTGGGTTT